MTESLEEVLVSQILKLYMKFGTVLFEFNIKIIINKKKCKQWKLSHKYSQTAG